MHTVYNKVPPSEPWRMPWDLCWLRGRVPPPGGAACLSWRRSPSSPPCPWCSSPPACPGRPLSRRRGASWRRRRAGSGGLSGGPAGGAWPGSSPPQPSSLLSGPSSTWPPPSWASGMCTPRLILYQFRLWPPHLAPVRCCRLFFLL
jgi:hypothetical protein